MNLSGFQPLAVGVDHAFTVRGLPLHHADPFDRMLIAQARHEHMALISNEAVFDGYAITRIW